jgi:hypothetical protein
MTPAERKRMFGGKSSGAVKRGYVASPGTGPKDETCASCAFMVRRHLAKVYLKCGLFPRPTGGQATDILARSPACREWAAPGSDAAKARGAK